MAEHEEPKGGGEPAGIIEPGTVFRDRLSDGAEGPEMVALPPGEFLMGSPDSDADAGDDEKPQHYVAIGYSFAIGRYPVTFGEYDRFVEALGRRKHDGFAWASFRLLPATGMSWYDARNYAAWLSEQTGKQYRLLSEAEWEYACRAGTETRYAVGDEITVEDAVFERSDFVQAVNFGETVEVGFFPPNPWKLHDMHGNVWEWVEDCWHDSYYYMPYPGAPADGAAWTGGGDDHVRVLRGGSLYGEAEDLRSASRSRMNTRDWDSYYEYQTADIGFRLARTLDP